MSRHLVTERAAREASPGGAPPSVTISVRSVPIVRVVKAGFFLDAESEDEAVRRDPTPCHRGALTRTQARKLLLEASTHRLHDLGPRCCGAGDCHRELALFVS